MVSAWGFWSCMVLGDDQLAGPCMVPAWCFWAAWCLCMVLWGNLFWEVVVLLCLFSEVMFAGNVNIEVTS